MSLLLAPPTVLTGSHRARPGLHRAALGGPRRVPALDGLRGLAVIAVVAFHAGAPWARGGVLGVDVFFVLSGFLITSVLLDEHSTTGGISLAAFWARRARRLLPGLALLVAVVLVVWGLADLPGGGSLREDALATLGYVANWHQAVAGQDYFSHAAPPSPLLHMWSLAVEEQFYVVWPVAVVLLLRRSPKGSRAARATVGRLAVGLAALSTAEMVVLSLTGTSVSRLYYGTDTHASGLLVGAAAAAVVPMVSDGRRARHASRPSGPGSAWVSALALGALAAAVVLLPSTWVGLYRGGYLAVAAAVGVVVAGVVRRPASLTARLLSAPPLVTLGRASYGIYLWHWPAVLVVDHQRTGLTGSSLLTLRLALAITLGLLSWMLVEVRVLEVSLPRPGRALVPALGVLAAVAGLVLVAPTPAAVGSDRQLVSLQRMQDAAVTTSTAGTVAGTGHRPRVLLVGDSVAVTLSWSLVPAARSSGVDVVGRGVLGCGIATGGQISDGARTGPSPAGCADWPQRWAAAMDQQHPDVLAVLVGRWELVDRTLHGRWQHVGEPDMDAYLTSRLDAVAALAQAHHARLALLTAPCFGGGELPDGSSTVMDQPARLARWNQLVAEAVARHPGLARLDDVHATLCPSGSYSATVDGVVARWDDGIHLTLDGGRLVAGTLVPELAAQAHDARAASRS